MNEFRKIQMKFRYAGQYRQFCRMTEENDRIFPMGRKFPVLKEMYKESGTAKGHYFHQDLLIARRIFQNCPQRHVDIGSRIDGFVAHVASFREIEVFDIRPLKESIENVVFRQVDFMGADAEKYADCCDSVSSLHAVEHFGLGRYGDPLDVNGHLKGLDCIYRILKAGGKLYFSVPIGPQRVEFNAHRVFSVKYLLDLLSERYRIDFFSYVDDKGALLRDVELTGAQAENSYGCRYGCGIFEMTKK